MISRILTGAALSGMLLATGCGGGTGSGLGPSASGGNSLSPVITSAGKGAVSVSVLVPRPAARVGASGSSRKPEYVSPGSSGISVMISGSALPASVVYALGSLGTPSAIPANPSGPGSKTFSFPSTVGGAAYSACAAGGCSMTYSYAAASTAGYYNLTMNFSGLLPAPTGGGGYIFGVVLQDILHNNFVLSEGQSAAPVVVNAIGPVSAAVPLAAVAASAYLCDATCSGAAPPPFAAAATSSGAAINTYGVTAYIADELGYMIPYQAGRALDGGQTWAVQACNSASPVTGSGCTPASPSVATVKACPATSIASSTAVTVDPVIDLTADCAAGVFTVGAATGIVSAGTLASLLAVPTSSGAPTFATPTAGYTAGIALNLACAVATTTTIAVVQQHGTGGVLGFTYSANNYPTSSGIIAIAPGNSARGNTIPLNCSPGAGVTIN